MGEINREKSFQNFYQQIPEPVNQVYQRLQSAGEAYWVGGAVRDCFLNTPSHDWDIATRLRPQAVRSLFDQNQLDTIGLKHGTVMVLSGGYRVEVTTYRNDGLYTDGRHPDQVTFSDSIQEDLARRDFTINALALDNNGHLVDPFGGLEDLQKGLVRAVGNPVKRFQEDALRLVRCVRFANRLRFEIEPQTQEAVIQLAPSLCQVSRERLASEWLQILLDDPEGVERLSDLGLLKAWMPELEACFHCQQENPHHCFNVGHHSVVAAKAGTDLEFRLAAILHDVGKPVCKTLDGKGIAHFYGHAEKSQELSKQILRALFIPKNLARSLSKVIGKHDYLSTRPSKLARLVREWTPQELDLLIRLKRADVGAQSDLERQEKLALIQAQESEIQRLLAGPHRLTDLDLSGRDLQQLGLTGPEIHETLQQLLVFVMEDPRRNQREKLLNWVKKQGRV